MNKKEIKTVARSEPEYRFDAAEWGAIQVHKYFLSQRAGHEIGIKEAIEDWLERHSQQWREKRMKLLCRDQAKEISNYIWCESEKAGSDLGKALAIEWIKEHAGPWREKWEKEHG